MTERCGFVAIVGAPNAGKSTLLNQVVGSKIAIVSHKVQTTRTRTLGMVARGDSQIIFIDTPGIFEPRRRLDRAMVAAAWGGAVDADLIVLLVDATRGVDKDVARIVAGLKAQNRTAILCVNKVDAIRKDKLLTLTARLNEEDIFTEIFMISALSGDGVDDLVAHLAACVPEGPWHFPSDQMSDVSDRLLAAEITREKLYLKLHQELPYSSAVETELWEERKDGSLRIEQTIYVERKSQKGIVIGKGGETLKEIGQEARVEMESLLECRVHLFLHVKVRERWSEQREHYRNIGLDFID